MVVLWWIGVGVTAVVVAGGLGGSGGGCRSE
jgi:hypothetical protein